MITYPCFFPYLFHTKCNYPLPFKDSVKNSLIKCVGVWVTRDRELEWYGKNIQSFCLCCLLGEQACYARASASVFEVCKPLGMLICGTTGNKGSYELEVHEVIGRNGLSSPSVECIKVIWMLFVQWFNYFLDRIYKHLFIILLHAIYSNVILYFGLLFCKKSLATISSKKLNVFAIQPWKLYWYCWKIKISLRCTNIYFRSE